MFYALGDYIDIGNNQLLKIKLKNRAGSIYGTLETVSIPKYGITPTAPQGARKVTSGSLRQFLNYEDCIVDKGAVPGFTCLSIASSDIESIEVTEDEVFGS